MEIQAFWLISSLALTAALLDYVIGYRSTKIKEALP